MPDTKKFVVTWVMEFIFPSNTEESKVIRFTQILHALVLVLIRQ